MLKTKNSAYQSFNEADGKYFKTTVNEDGFQTFIADLNDITSPEYYEARSPDGVLLETREYLNGLHGIEIEKKYKPDGSYIQTEKSNSTTMTFVFEVTHDGKASAPVLIINDNATWETEDNILEHYIRQKLEYINQFKPGKLEKIKQIFNPD